MDLGGFVVQGSRPPSVQSSHRLQSARSKQGYHTVAYQSSVDETLFSSHHLTKVHEPVTDFKAPWEYPKPKPMGPTFAEPKIKDSTQKKTKGRPLLWAPVAGTTIHNYKKREDRSMTPQSSTNNMDQSWNSRDHFRHLKHTPTFVDESLFGDKLQEPTFEAPWNEKSKGERRKGPKFYLWDPSGSQTHNGLNIDLHHDKYPSHGRPKTALGIYRDRNKGSSGGSKAVPVWKP